MHIDHESKDTVRMYERILSRLNLNPAPLTDYRKSVDLFFSIPTFSIHLTTTAKQD